tara:strand:+ start:32 stop:415 length:384 start_codon:yes stop_codon:yes gene_type:complete
MIKNFLIISCIGKMDKIGLKTGKKFFIHDFNNKFQNNDLIVVSILNLIKKHKVNLGNNFSILVNIGPGSFSSLRAAIAVSKGLKLSKKISLFGYKDTDLGQFTLANIELLIDKNLLEKNLIKPLYLS